MRWIIAIALACQAVLAAAETLVTPAKVLEMTERGFVLMVGTEPLAVEDSSETRVWIGRQSSKRDGLRKGDAVYARIKTDADPPILKEIADESTWKWLESIRKTHRKGTIEKMDAKYLHLRLDDGSMFAYRITEKSDLVLKSKPTPTLGDLAAGMTVYVKGRLLPTLDTWVAELTDVQPAVKPASASKGSTGSAAKAPKPVQLPASGKLEGVILGDSPPLKMFDILVGVRTYHITTNLETRYQLDGKSADRAALIRHANVLVHYKRDKHGRLIASKVEVFRK